jgi:ParB family chromosome partitioning protein
VKPRYGVLVPVDQIIPDPDQPRKDFAAVDTLAKSIKALGLQQPITLRPNPLRAARGKSCREKYMIRFGETRWRACVKLGHKTIRTNIIPSDSDVNNLIAQLAENVDRKDLSPLEEARGYAKLAAMGLEIPEIAERSGQVEFRVRWRLQLLQLDPAIMKLFEAEQLDRHTAMEIARLPKHKDQRKILRMVNNQKLVGWKAVRNAVEATLNETTTADLFGDSHAKPSKEDIAKVKAMESRIDKVVSMVNRGWKNGECIVANKVDPGRAAVMADKLANIRKALVTMERELRNISAQAVIALDHAA